MWIIIKNVNYKEIKYSFNYSSYNNCVICCKYNGKWSGIHSKFNYYSNYWKAKTKYLLKIKNRRWRKVYFICG